LGTQSLAHSNVSSPSLDKKLRTCHTSFHGHSFRPLTSGNDVLICNTLLMFSTSFKILSVDPSTDLSFLQSLPYRMYAHDCISLCVYTLLYASKYNIFILCFLAGSFFFSKKGVPGSASKRCIRPSLLVVYSTKDE
jgi:hypothetical protein